MSIGIREISGLYICEHFNVSTLSDNLLIVHARKTMPPSKHRHHHGQHPDVLQFQKELQAFQDRLTKFINEGIPVDPKLQAALDQCKTDVTALAAQNGGSAASTQAAIDAVNAIDAIAKAALTPTLTPGINP
jgi:hypothetical protein